MSRHSEPDRNQKPRYHLPLGQHAVWVQSGRPDPNRQPGVPDRIVISLHREGAYYRGTLASWEYREIQVRRPTGPNGEVEEVPEMIVDASAPTMHEIEFELGRPLNLRRAITGLIAVLESVMWPF